MEGFCLSGSDVAAYDRCLFFGGIAVSHTRCQQCKHPITPVTPYTRRCDDCLGVTRTDGTKQCKGCGASMEIIAGRVVTTSHGHQGESRAAYALFCDDCHVYDPPGSLHCKACNEETDNVGRLLRAQLQEADREREREQGLPEGLFSHLPSPTQPPYVDYRRMGELLDLI